MNKEFSTSDLNVASTLLALGHQLVALDRSNPRRVRFCFAFSDDIKKKVDGYWNDSIQLPPQKLLAAQRSLKAQLYA